MSLSSYIKKLDKAAKVAEQMPRRVAREAVNFSLDRFRQQNWIDNSTEPWKKRKPLKRETKKRSSRSVLVDTGRLKRSIRIISVTKDRAIIGTDVPYARAHNDGFRGRVKQSVKAHSRTVRSGRETRKVDVKAHSRTINQNIPKRRFIGQSALLEKKITRMITAEFRKAIK